MIKKISIYFICLKKKYPQQVITNPYFKQRQPINKIIEQTKTTLNNKPKTEFQKPKTVNEWRNFHKNKRGGHEESI